MTTHVQLDKLTFDLDHNSRTGLDEAAMSELVKSIDANGLITPLTVRPLASGNYAVIDGHRRLEALNRLYENKESIHVPVLVREADDKDAVALSLAANIVRLPLHPADQYQAFAKMLDEGMQQEEIAARFALPLKDVERVLALGRVIPAALDLYRKGEIDADTIRLFASCSEERQLAVWRKAYEEDSLTRWQVQRLLSYNTIDGRSPVARLVGADAYEAAGGRIERDLFNDGLRWLDTELALTLAKQAMGALKEKLEAEGWSFVKVKGDMPGQWRGWERVRAERVLDEAQAQRLTEIETRINEIDEIDCNKLDEEEAAKLSDERDELEAQSVDIEEAAPFGFTAEQKQRSGVVLMEDYSIVYGVVWPEKVKQPEPGEKPADDGKKPWPATLIEELQDYGTDAVQVAVAKGSAVDHMAFTCAAFICQGHEVPTMLGHGQSFRYPGHDKVTQVEQQLDAQLANMKVKEGRDFWKLYDTIRACTDTDIATLFGLVVAGSITKQRTKDQFMDFRQRFEQADVRQVWQPSEAFFKRLNQQQLSDIVKEMKQRPLKDGLKKQEYVEYALNWAKKMHWLPKLLSNLLPPLTSEQKARIEEIGTKAKKPAKMKKAA